MEWAIAVVAVAVLGVGAVVATGRMGGMEEEPVRDQYRQQLPDTPLTRTDVEGLRFGTVLRGYAMGQVDDVLERLGREISDRDTRLAELEERLRGRERELDRDGTGGSRATGDGSDVGWEAR